MALLPSRVRLKDWWNSEESQSPAQQGFWSDRRLDVAFSVVEGLAVAGVVGGAVAFVGADAVVSGALMAVLLVGIAVVGVVAVLAALIVRGARRRRKRRQTARSSDSV